MRHTQVHFISYAFDIELEVTANCIPGYKGRGPSMDHAGGEPPEPAQAEDLCVVLIIEDVHIDITDKLPKELMRSIEAQCLEKAQEMRDDERNEAAERRG